jgi:hypothetical protein
MTGRLSSLILLMSIKRLAKKPGKKTIKSCWIFQLKAVKIASVLQIQVQKASYFCAYSVDTIRNQVVFLDSSKKPGSLIDS